jgi:glucose/arabinose dehydrogenase
MIGRRLRCSAGIVAVSLLAASCSSDPASTAPVTFAVATTPAATTPGATTPAATTGATAAPSLPATATTPPPAATTAAAPPGTVAPQDPLGDPTIALTELGTFRQPVGMSWRAADATTYIVEQDGRIVIIADGQPAAVALDMAALTAAGGERGLLGLAIDKAGAFAYVDYTDNNGNTKIDEYAINPDGTFDTASRREVLGIDQPYANHNGGQVAIGPDGMLYIGTGDGGSANDPERRALDVTKWLGKILRIYPRPTADVAYSVPSDNPFTTVAGARPEIWAVGLRNPWRFSFDRVTGDLWIADVGQNQWEEVDVAWAEAGGGRGMNFGWSAFEGNHRFNNDQPPDGATPPIYEYPHGDAGCSISGGVRYRGKAVPALVGWYVYADYCSGQVRGLKIEGSAVTGELTLGKAANLSAVTEGPDGELFVLSVDGPVYAITPG